MNVKHLCTHSLAQCLVTYGYGKADFLTVTGLIYWTLNITSDWQGGRNRDTHSRLLLCV